MSEVTEAASKETNITESKPGGILKSAADVWKGVVKDAADSTYDGVLDSKVVASMKDFSDNPEAFKKIFDVVDERIKISADLVREEVKVTMAEVRVEQRRSLYINIATVVFAIIAVLINKIF